MLPLCYEQSGATEADLIPKLRSLYCRVPLGRFSRTPWSSRPEHLCWFAVRADIFTRTLAFLASLGHLTRTVKVLAFALHLSKLRLDA